VEIHRLLEDDPKLPGVRVRELLERLGCTASKTVVDDYLREVRLLFAPPVRTFARITYRPEEVLDLLRLLTGWPVRAHTLIGLGLADPLAPRLSRQAKLTRDVAHGPSGLDRQPHATVNQLLRILPWSGRLESICFGEDRTLASKSPSIPACLRFSREVRLGVLRRPRSG
jgi:hypothetical protein